LAPIQLLNFDQNITAHMHKNSGSQSGRWETPGGGEAEMGDWRAVKQKWAVGGAIGDPVNNYIPVVLLTLSDQMS